MICNYISVHTTAKVLSSISSKHIKRTRIQEDCFLKCQIMSSSKTLCPQVLVFYLRLQFHHPSQTYTPIQCKYITTTLQLRHLVDWCTKSYMQRVRNFSRIFLKITKTYLHWSLSFQPTICFSICLRSLC